MNTPNLARRRAGLALAAVVLVCLPACADDSSAAGDTAAVSTAAPTTAAAPSTTQAPTTTVEVTTTTTAPDPIVLTGTWAVQHPRVAMPSGANTDSVALEGDAVGQGASLTTATPTGQEGYFVFHLISPKLGDGVVGVQDWAFTDGDGTGTGEVTGLSGAFADMVGTLDVAVTDSASALLGGTYAFELQPAPTPPAPGEPTETRTIAYEVAGVGGWIAPPAMGQGNLITGDVVGSEGWTGSINDGYIYAVAAGTLGGEGDGVYVTVSRVLTHSAPFTLTAEFYGLSGAFAGFRGEGTGTALSSPDAAVQEPGTFTFEVSR